MVFYVVAFFFALALAYVLTPLLRKPSLKFEILDHPVPDIKIHLKPVPYLGGLAIWLAFIVTLLGVRLLTSFPTGTLHNLRGIFYGGTLIMVLGLIDDIWKLDYRVKLFGQFIASIILILYNIRIEFISSLPLSIFLTIFWVVGITNAVNIIDIMDGLAAGVVVIAGLAFFFIALPTEKIYVNFAALALAGSCLGFLRYNWRPAKIFMGDSGSLFIGFILAAISLGESYTTINNIGLFAPFLVLGIPIYDTLLVIFFRILKGKSIFAGSRDHFAFRLEAMGYNRKKVVLINYYLTAILGLAAFLITTVKFELAVIIYAAIIAFAILYATRLIYVKVE
ncbi:putative undecaprenyl-phosphate N-acetylglucosaminyl 1-phosphate transferase [subsurface metagenome]